MQSNAQTATGSARTKALAALALGALGVVSGDIGTSPLYSVLEPPSEKDTAMDVTSSVPRLSVTV